MLAALLINETDQPLGGLLHPLYQLIMLVPPDDVVDVIGRLPISDYGYEVMNDLAQESQQYHSACSVTLLVYRCWY